MPEVVTAATVGDVGVVTEATVGGSARVLDVFPEFFPTVFGRAVGGVVTVAEVG